MLGPTGIALAKSFLAQIMQIPAWRRLGFNKRERKEFEIFQGLQKVVSIQV